MNENIKNLMILVLVVFNIFFLYKSRELSHQINSIEERTHVVLNDFSDLKVKKDFTREMGKGLKIITFIWEISCSSCVQHEIELLNQYHEKFGENLQVILVKNSDNAKLFDAKFPYKTVENVTEVINQNIVPQNPVSVVFDDHFVYGVRKVKLERPYSKLLSQHFYKNQLRFFSKVQ